MIQFSSLTCKPTLSESLNSPVKTTKVDKNSFMRKMGEMSAAAIGGHSFEMEHIDGGAGYLIKFKKDGNTEFHHVDSKFQGGAKSPSPDTSNALRFAALMKSRIKQSLDSGESVKISAHHNLADNFGRLIASVSTKYPDYEVKKTSDEKHPITGDNLSIWKLNKKT